MSTGALAESGLAPQGNLQEPVEAEAQAYWRPLRYFCLYRLLVASLFFVAIMVAGGALNIGEESPRLFQWVSIAYLIAAIVFVLRVPYGFRGFNLQLTLQVATDVVALTLLMHASGGSRSGVAVMIFVVLAGAGLVGQGRLTLFYAAIAALAVLTEQGYRVLSFGDDPGAFFRVGLTSVGFFGTAISARLLGQRVIAQETLARRRGFELAEQLRVSERVIRDMQDGILIVDAEGRVRQNNPQAAWLLDAAPSNGDYLASISEPLAEHYLAWRAGKSWGQNMLPSPRTGRMVRLRFLPSGDGGQAVIYLEDMGRLEEQARQLKLAALGRLTANMAHEIRNPLAAISHAAELLQEESQSTVERRLARIIGDNTQRLNRLVAEVMELGRRDRVSPEMVLLDSFLLQFAEELAVADPGARRRVAISIEPGTNAHVCFDRSHLHRILWNLASNALRHATAGDAAVRISVRQAPAVEGAAQRIELHIVDDGPGIEQSLRSQVFEPFFTTHGSGTGLGLYIARELCDANGAVLDLLEGATGAHFRIVFSGEPCQIHAEHAAT